MFSGVWLGCAVLLAMPPGTAPAADGPDRKPNILLILADDMGWGDLRCHGNNALDTPALDRLQSQSIELERFFVSPLCSPTRSSLLTGRHHLRLGVLSTTGGLEVMQGAEETLAEVLRPAGYATGCFGKWHNGSNHPSTARGQGFDEFYGFSGGFFSNYFDPELEHDGVVAERKGFITDVLADAALAFIDTRRSEPFFCYVPFNACHSPMQAPAALFAKYAARGFESKTAAVYAMLENLDANVGRLLDRLDSLGIAEHTIVMFTSDNGPNTARFNDGMRGAKGSLFEGGQRVPCFIRWPGTLEAGRRVSRIVQHVDVLPTLVDLVGVPRPQTLPLDGVILEPLLRGTADSIPDRLLYEIGPRDGKNGDALTRYPGTVRSETHRWVHDGTRPLLFDLRDDPGETKNRVMDQPDVAARLSAAYDAWFDGAVAATSGSVRRFPITLERETELLTPSATREGGAKTFGKGWDNDWAVFPSDSATIVWNLDVAVAGRYDVTVLHTAQVPGGRIRVMAGDDSAETVVAEAHDPPEIPRRDLVPRWEVPDKAFRPVSVGTLTLPAGPTSVPVRGDPSIEIQSVRLRRSEDAASEIRLPAIFSDHMVLQCDRPLPIWGRATPGTRVVVEFAGQRRSTSAALDGRWRVTLDALPASAESRDMQVRLDESPRGHTIRDVVVGEVWACGGQSNMEFDMKSLVSGSAEIAASANRSLRQFVVLKQPAAAEPADDVPGFWAPARPGTTEDFVAVGYSFAREIQRELQTPVGLIKVCWGGSRVEPWISPSAIASEPVLATDGTNMNALSARNKAAFRAWLVEHGREDRPRGDPARFIDGPASPENGWVMVRDPGPATHPSLPMFGAVWFRKEVVLTARQTGAVQVLQFGPAAQFDEVYWNGSRVGECTVDSFTGITSTRHYLIAPALLREGRNRLAVRMFAPAVAPGFSWHPSLGTTKLTDGWMAKAEYAMPPLEAAAQKAVPPLTGQHILPGRLFNGMVHPLIPYVIRGVLWYQGESNTVDPKRYETSFPLLIEDWRQRWGQGDFPFLFCQLANFGAKRSEPAESTWAELREAQATIDGDTVMVSSKQAPGPIAVRYAWADNPTCNLYDAADLPAVPFRTDDFAATAAGATPRPPVPADTRATVPTKP